MMVRVVNESTYVNECNQLQKALLYFLFSKIYLQAVLAKLWLTKWETDKGTESEWPVKENG